ncbi:adenylyl cyclase [Gonapodya prolifera JEL478]|uniref:Adenylyl cyclase n=1 Tax=Gonapodya prolifera (strain JEL478) TaxID=1344416 RepID=A0A139B045_GONPJ|nr:adenylyl cyclase [Gonapodya prolifera JEL478]|eukprot:KXS22366.1 adenylyl cyclase [Gonapodya prolifera JEL478]
MDEPPRFGAEGSGEALYATTERVRFEDVIPNFVSQHVRKKLDKYSAEGHSDMKSFKSSAESAFAAVVMADVSGYSALTANLAERGPVGAEILAKTMKGLLDKVIQIIIFYGGDIVKFIGDAIMFYWKLDGPLEDIDPTLGEDLEPADLARRAELVVQAAICCSEILKQYGTYPINIPDCTTTELKIHLGIGAGRIFDVHVGGDPGRWEHLIGGDAVSQLANVLDQAPPGESRLALSHTALKHMKGSINMSALEIVDYNKKAAVILHFDKDRIRRNTTARPTLADDLALWDIASPTQNIELYRQFINHSALFKLQSDINQSKVFSSEFPGLSELMSLFELRQATTLFVRIGGYAQDGFRWFETKDDLEDMQTAMEIVQKALFRFQGSLRQFHVDDKGAILLSFFGLPPHAHENDAQYGVKAALEIAEEFGRFFEHFNIGITTGVIAIGGVGNSVRTEYALMGDSINMAARIMCLEAAQNAVACDERTYNLCSKDFTFEDMGQHKVKGKKNPVKVFRPKCAVADTRVQKTNDPEGMGLVVGRGKEKAMLSESVRTHINEGGGGLLVFEGDGGMGLTTLMKYAKLQAVNAGCPIT